MLINGAGEIDTVGYLNVNGTAISYHTQPLADGWLISSTNNFLGGATNGNPGNARQLQGTIHSAGTPTAVWGARAIGGVSLSRSAPIISVTFTANSSTITSATAHGLAANNFVRFAGSTNLPAAVTPWLYYQVNTVLTSTTFTIKTVATTPVVVTPTTAGSSYVICPDPNVSFFPNTIGPNLHSSDDGTPPSPPGGGRPIGVRCVTPLATASMVAGDHFTIYQKIPIERCSALKWHSTENPQKATLSFYVYTNKTGTYTGCIIGPTNSLSNTGSPTWTPAGGAGTTDAAGALTGLGGNLSRFGFTFQFSVPTANTWTKITKTLQTPFPSLSFASFTRPGLIRAAYNPGGVGLTVGITLAATGSNSTIASTPTSADGTNMLNLGINANSQSEGVYSDFGHGNSLLAPLPAVGSANGSAINNLFDVSGNYFYFCQAQLEAGDSATEYIFQPPSYHLNEWLSEYEHVKAGVYELPATANSRYGITANFTPKKPYLYQSGNRSDNTSTVNNNITAGATLLALDLQNGFLKGYVTAGSTIAASPNNFLDVTLISNLRIHPHDYYTNLVNSLNTGLAGTTFYSQRLN
jgi:hypothetical protein